MAARAPAKRPRTRLAPEARREQILDVAAVVFRGRAYADVSLDEVAQAAGVARGLINHHFGTKRGLYVEVVREAMRAPALPVPELVAGQTLAERFAQAAREWLGALERDPVRWLEAVNTSGAGDPQVAAIIAETREQASRRLALISGLGPLEELSAERRAIIEVFRGAIEAALRQWLEDDRVTRAQVEGFIVAVGVRAGDGLLEDMAAAMAAAAPGR